MTKRSLAFLCAVGFPLAAFAQTPTPMPRPVPAHTQADENFVLALTPAGKDGEGMSFIVTSAQTFNSSRGRITFNGTLARTDNGAYRLDYLLETNSSDGTSHTGSSVILTPGEPVQIVKNGDQFYNLRLDRYPTPTPATKSGSDDNKSGPGIGFMR